MRHKTNRLPLLRFAVSFLSLFLSRLFDESVIILLQLFVRGSVPKRVVHTSELDVDQSRRQHPWPTKSPFWLRPELLLLRGPWTKSFEAQQFSWSSALQTQLLCNYSKHTSTLQKSMNISNNLMCCTGRPNLAQFSSMNPPQYYRNVTPPTTVVSDSEGKLQISQRATDLHTCSEPAPTDVVCARGRQFWNHPGNRLYRKLVEASTQKYSQARNKMEKSQVGLAGA